MEELTTCNKYSSDILFTECLGKMPAAEDGWYDCKCKEGNVWSCFWKEIPTLAPESEASGLEPGAEASGLSGEMVRIKNIRIHSFNSICITKPTDFCGMLYMNEQECSYEKKVTRSRQKYTTKRSIYVIQYTEDIQNNGNSNSTL